MSKFFISFALIISELIQQNSLSVVKNRLYSHLSPCVVVVVHHSGGGGDGTGLSVVKLLLGRHSRNFYFWPPCTPLVGLPSLSTMPNTQYTTTI